MMKSVNRRQNLELVLTVVMGVLLLININSLANGVGTMATNLQLHERSQGVVTSLADAGDGIQGVTETGVVQSLLSIVTGGTGNSSRGQGSSNVEASNGANVSNSEGSSIGDWINQSGTWALGLFTPTEASAPAQFATALGQSLGTLPDPVQDAGESFNHMSRPPVSNVHAKEEVIERVRDIHANIAIMIVAW